jgi:ABC-type glycerol-3-phosphate transport system substrate-binding protein
VDRGVDVRLIAALIVLFAACVLIAGCGGDATSSDPWLGSWRETDSPEHYVLTSPRIRRAATP